MCGSEVVSWRWRRRPCVGCRGAGGRCADRNHRGEKACASDATEHGARLELHVEAGGCATGRHNVVAREPRARGGPACDAERVTHVANRGGMSRLDRDNLSCKGEITRILQVLSGSVVRRNAKILERFSVL